MNNCADCILEHIEDVEYRGHEIIIIRCPKCKNFIVDVRVDDWDGEMLAGYIDPSIYNAIDKAHRAVDRYEFERALSVEVPF